jgi:hypothetical protein
MWSELRSLIQAMPLAVAAPRIVRQASQRTTHFRQEFENSVQPLLESTITDTELRARLTESLLSYAAKSSFVIYAYTTMARVPFVADIAMLGLAFTRLYDDLLDGIGGPDLERRLGELIKHGRFTPATDAERLLDRMYREIDSRLGRPCDDPLYAAAVAAHRYQAQSRKQRDPTTPHATLLAITRGKGRYGTLTVFSLMQPNLSARERALIMEIGEALQMLDDYADYESDRRAGIRTLATEGLLHLADVAQHLRHTRPRLAAHYGQHAIRELLGVCYLAMCICFLDRRIPWLSARLPVKSAHVNNVSPTPHSLSTPDTSSRTTQPPSSTPPHVRQNRVIRSSDTWEHEACS